MHNLSAEGLVQLLSAEVLVTPSFCRDLGSTVFPRSTLSLISRVKGLSPSVHILAKRADMFMKDLLQNGLIQVEKVQ